jgi:hypothetical protein
MQQTFSPMNREDARAIATWRYEGTYALYNMGADGEALDLGDRLGDTRPHNQRKVIWRHF